MEKLSPFQFVNAIFKQIGSNEFAEGEKLNYATNILGEFLSDEGIEYGDERYDWSASAAKDLVNLEKEFWND